MVKKLSESGGVDVIPKHFIDSDMRWPNQHNNDIIVCEGNMECVIEWVDLGDYGEAPRLKVFNDYWAKLPQSDLIKAISEIHFAYYTRTTKEQVKAALKAYGFEDWTERAF